MEQIQEQELLKWQAVERPFLPRNKQFFTTAIVIAVLVGLILIFAEEWMLIITLAAILFAYYMWSTVPPREIEYKITTRGIYIHDQRYPWTEMSRWWVENKWGYQLLIIDVSSNFFGRIYLVLANNEEQVKTSMNKYLLMEKPKETTLDKLGKWLTEKFPLEK